MTARISVCHGIMKRRVGEPLLSVLTSSTHTAKQNITVRSTIRQFHNHYENISRRKTIKGNLFGRQTLTSTTTQLLTSLTRTFSSRDGGDLAQERNDDDKYEDSIDANNSNHIFKSNKDYLKFDINDHRGYDEDDALYDQYAEEENSNPYAFSKRNRNKNDNDKNNDDDLVTKRIWLDPKTPLTNRVSRFVSLPLGTMHHLDIKLASVDLIRECGKLKSFEGMKYAQDILDRLIEEKRHVNVNTWPLIVVPDRPFKVVMYGWANLCKKVPFASQRMREVLDLMIQESEYDKLTKEKILAERTKNSQGISADLGSDDDTEDDMFEGLSCEPTVDIYNTLLQGLSQAASRSISAAIEAEQVLSKMEKMHRIHGWHTKPNTRSYSLVLNAYAKCKHSSAGDKAEAVLRDMIECHEQEKHVYLEEYGVEYNVQDPSGNRRKVVTPDTIAYTLVIQAHGQSESPDGAEKALGLLSELIHSDNSALELDAFVFATAINAYSKKAAKKKSPKARNEAAERAEEIWWLMVDELKKKKATVPAATPENGTSPTEQRNSLVGNIVPFNAALNAWAISFTSESPHRAEELLHRLLDPELQKLTKIQPDTASFNTVMLAWSKASKVEKSSAPEKAEEILKLLKELSLSEDPTKRIRPNVQSYVTVMNAYAEARRSDSVYHVRRLLNELLREGHANNDDKDITAVPFTVLLKAVAKSKPRTDRVGMNLKDEDAFGTADKDVNDDDDRQISAADPYSIALETYAALQNDFYEVGVRADHFAYASMLDVIAEYTDPDSIERRQRIEQVFYDACQSGQVSSLVVRSMQEVCPNEHVLKDMLKLHRDDAVVSIESVNIFPKQWTRFVPPDFRRVSHRSAHFRKQSDHYRSRSSSSNNNNSDRHGHKKHRGTDSNNSNNKTSTKPPIKGTKTDRRSQANKKNGFIF